MSRYEKSQQGAVAKDGVMYIGEDSVDQIVAELTRNDKLLEQATEMWSIDCLRAGKAEDAVEELLKELERANENFIGTEERWHEEEFSYKPFETPEEYLRTKEIIEKYTKN